MTEQEAAAFKHRLNSRNYYLRHLVACRARCRAYYAAHRERWTGSNGYRAKRMAVQP